MNKQIAYQFLAAIIGAMTIGIFVGYNLLIYGANHGCFPFIDNLMQDEGYLSCGPFGFFIGAIIGAVLGVSLYRIDWRKILKSDNRKRK